MRVVARRTRTVLAVLVASLTLAACGASGDGGAIRVVSPTAAQELLAADPPPVLIDVRTPEEFAEGHLEGAELVDFNAPDFRDRIAAYPRDGSYVIYCRSGNRSAGARAIMDELGFSDVADIDGGIAAWAAGGLPVVG